ncbi:ABC transporter substrate-binding protein [Paenibacillus sp. R14(2021)]|uniref:ABC transporter substrate-binding protein n=1 Tax=Paenibacillus sp. R14(2021) TaxID=2859228 RepID=UPI001C6141FD|nr:extracellular solute-binding protein [Paenibacillus sp. R14(2021)]
MKEPVNDWERRLAGKPPVRNGFTSELERKVRERIYMNTTKRRALFRAAAAIMSMVILIGCGWWFRDDVIALLKPKGQEEVPAALSKDPLANKEYVLKVQQFEQMNSFEYLYKKPFIIRHPSVKLKMANAAYKLAQDPEKFEAWFDQEQPDIVQLPMNLYTKLAADGKLKPLDALMKASKFDLGALHAPLIDYLRQAGGNGELYGLSPDFDTMVLYINEDVFAAHGIAVPEGEQSMEQILQLAARFQGTGVTGLSATAQANKFSLVELIGQTNGLQTMKSVEGHYEATVNSAAWKKIWDSVAAGYRDGWIKPEKAKNYGKNGLTMAEMAKQDAFALGQVAMTIAPSYYYTNYEQYAQEEAMKANWAALPIHVDPSATNPGRYLSANTIYALNASSIQSEAAWQLLQFIVGSKLTDSPSTRYQLLKPLADRTGMNPATSKHWDAFYATGVDPVKAAENTIFLSDPDVSAANGILYKLGSEEMESILNDSISVSAALESLQSKLETQLLGIEQGKRP